jgi:alpha-amylase/alpha-mannosidase (GH57 family)
MATTGTLRVVLLWHMHQPYYKDLITGEYRMPWVRMHALKDYYGMVKLLDEFPQVHQNFNLVPSLVDQIQDYASGKARDPFFEIAVKPAAEFTPQERRFALQYLFHANIVQLIGRYPRYRELWEQFRWSGEDAVKAEPQFRTQDYVDLQVLSQLAWFDEYFLEQPDVQELVKKGRNFNESDQKFVAMKEKEIIAAVLPAYKAAAAKGSIELSATPYYHPILPLLCDTEIGAVSSPGLTLPGRRFTRPEDATEQIRRALDAHEKNFGVRPKGMWPSEGSVSEDALKLAAKQGVEWMATDEGVLARSLGVPFERNSQGKLVSGSAERLYNIYRYEKGDTRMNLIFRDHQLSDLIGFVYAGMGAKEAAAHLIQRIKDNAQSVLSHGQDAVVPIILDGENAWETYDKSGREFLRRFYDALEKEPGVEAVTISEASAKHKPTAFGQLKSLMPGSWINANFDVWIGAPEDNKAWDCLSEARDFYDKTPSTINAKQKELAYEELLISEGSDWNWWYGPEHHSANDREFDELYRKHLSNVYQALGAIPPDYLAQPITKGGARPTVVAQTAYVHPRINGRVTGYFDWMGAAMYTAERTGGSMHGKQFVFESVYAGIDKEKLYGRVDLSESVPSGKCEFVVQFEVDNGGRKLYKLVVAVQDSKVSGWSLMSEGETGAVIASSSKGSVQVEAAVEKMFQFSVPLELMNAHQGSRIRMRFSLWKNGLPVDGLPVEGSMMLHVADEDSLAENVYAT